MADTRIGVQPIEEKAQSDVAPGDAVGQAGSGIARFATLNADLIRRCSGLDRVNFAAA
jgi:hypothetical protein